MSAVSVPSPPPASLRGSALFAGLALLFLAGFGLVTLTTTRSDEERPTDEGGPERVEVRPLKETTPSPDPAGANPEAGD